MLFSAISVPGYAAASSQDVDIPLVLSAFDRAVARNDQVAIDAVVQRLSGAEEEIAEILLPEEIADLQAAMAYALVSIEPTIAIAKMQAAVEINRELVDALQVHAHGAEGIRAPVQTTLDIYAAREALYARLLDAQELASSLDAETQARRFGMEAEALYRLFLTPGAIQLQTMGAGPPPPTSLSQDASNTTEPFQVVRVFYGTNRAERSQDPNSAYSNERADLTYGTVEVSVPNDRAPGSIPRPRIGGERANLHILLRSVNRLGADGFGGALRSSVDGARSDRDEVFIFIHGHAVRFDQAARQTAQLAVDLDIRDGAIMYSWPNGESVGSYQISQAAVGLSSRRFTDFLETVMDEVGDADIHIIAHSMGNRLVLNALDRLYDPDHGEAIFKHIFWASADIDADLFEDTLNEIEGVAEGMTAYTSGRDRALQLSASLSGGYLRVGQSEPLSDVAEIITAVDTTQLSTGWTGHGDFSNSLIEDMQSVVWLSLPPEGRCILVQVELNETSRFWRAVDDRPECAKDSFRRALWAVRQFGDQASARIQSALDNNVISQDDREDWERAVAISDRLAQ